MNNDNLVAFVIFVIRSGIFLAIGWIWGDIVGYKYGQIAAINGHINYELKVQPDNSYEWTYIEKPN